MEIKTEVINFFNFLSYYNEYYSLLSHGKLSRIDKALESLDEGQVVNMVSRLKLIERTFLEIDQMIDQAKLNLIEKVE